MALVDASEAALRVVRSLGLSPSDVADVLQEASIRAWRHRDQRRGEFKPWFIAIAYREARRPRRRWMTLPAFWTAAAGEPERDERLRDVLLPDDLGEPLRAVFASYDLIRHGGLDLWFTIDDL